LTERQDYAAAPLPSLVELLPRNELAFVAGLTTGEQPLVCTLPQVCPLLLLGQACIGKTRLLQGLLAQLLATNSPAHLQVVMLDPLGVDLEVFEDCPHLYRAQRALLPAAQASQEPTALPLPPPPAGSCPYYLVVADELAHLWQAEALRDRLQVIVQQGQAKGVGIIAVSQVAFHQEAFPFAHALVFATPPERGIPQRLYGSPLRQLQREAQPGRYFLALLDERVRARDLSSGHLGGDILTAPPVSREIVQQVLVAASARGAW
jgi:hypothetical protein